MKTSTSSRKQQGYPLFGSPFNEVTDYGFNADSLVTDLLPKNHRPSTHADAFWKVTNSFCLYRNKKAIRRDPAKPVRAKDYVQSNPLDVISISSGDIICHSTGSNLETLRICKWTDNGSGAQLKKGNVFDQEHQIEGISHCTNHYNDETIILSWHRHNALFLAMKHNEDSNLNEFEIIDEIAPSSNDNNFRFQSGVICSLPFVWNSGLEDSAFFTSNGSLIFPLDHGMESMDGNHGMNHKSKPKRTEIPLQYQQCPPWTEIMWSQHPRVVRVSCDIELLTFDLRIDHNSGGIGNGHCKLKPAQKFSYFDPITSITSYQHYIATVGLQGLGLYDDRMLKRPLNKWRFYDFDYVMGDGMFSRLQIYPLQSGVGEHWIIASGHGPRVLIFPIFSGIDSPIIGSMPFNIDRYTACFGHDVGVNAVTALPSQRRGGNGSNGSSHCILAMSEYGSLLCTQFASTPSDTVITVEDEQKENEKLMELEMALHVKSEREKIEIPKQWREQIESEFDDELSRYKAVLSDSKIIHFARFLIQFEDDIMSFAQIPRTTEQIRNQFEGEFEDLDDLTLFDYYRVFKHSDFGLHSFQIKSAVNLDNDGDGGDGVYRNMAKVITTYFVSKRLNADYLPIKEEYQEESGVAHQSCIVIDDDGDDNKVKIKADDVMEDSLDLGTLGLLSQQMSQQEAEEDDMRSSYSGNEDGDKFSNQLSQMTFDGERLFETQYDITDQCRNLMESLARKWRDGKKQYVDNDWREVNGIKLDYHGMTRHKFPKRKKRKVKRSWT